MDNCSAHRGRKAVERFRTKWPNAILIHTPVYDADAEKWRAIDLVDHVNGDGLDNRRANLRVATRAENQRNTRGRPQHRASMHKGVALCAGKRVRPWRATIQIDGHQVHLGYFGEEEDAARAYNAAALLHFGEFAFLNSFERLAA
jgi:hypothetical protein